VNRSSATVAGESRCRNAGGSVVIRLDMMWALLPGNRRNIAFDACAGNARLPRDGREAAAPSSHLETTVCVPEQIGSRSYRPRSRRSNPRNRIPRPVPLVS